MGAAAIAWDRGGVNRMPLGGLVRRLFLARQVERIFAFRHTTIAALFAL